MQKSRIEAYTDNIFSIVATLMVFNLHLPNGVPVFHALQLELPKIIVFVFSFMIIGIYWIAHHSLYHFVARTNRALLWRNIYFLLFVSFISLSASVLGDHPFDHTAICLYGGNLICVNLSMNYMWRGILGHCLTNRTRDDITPQIRRHLNFLQLMPAVANAAAMAISFYKPEISLIIFVFVPLFYIVPNPGLQRLLVEEVR